MSVTRTQLILEAASRLGTLIDAHSLDAGRQLGDQLRPWLRDGETLPDFALVLELPLRRIRHGAQGLRQCRDRLDQARCEEGEARFRRDQTAAALCRKLVEIRRLLTSVLSPQGAATQLGIAGKTARESQPALLLSQAGAWLELLRDPRRLTIPRAGCYFDTATVAADLEPLAAACRAACDRLGEIRRAIAALLTARDRAQTEILRLVRRVVPILNGWLLLVGRGDLAAKLRQEVPR